MGNLINSISFINQTRSQNFLSKLEGQGYDIKKLTYPMDIESNSNISYMVIYINENSNVFNGSKTNYKTINAANARVDTYGKIPNAKTVSSTDSLSNNGYLRISTAICLYIPDNALNFNYANKWESGNVSNAEVIRETLIKPAMQAGGELSKLKGITAAGTLWDGVNNFVDQSGSAISRKLAGTILGAGGDAYMNAISRNVVNDKIMFSYRMPDPRTFSFEYNLFPRSKEELFAIYNIIKTLKFYASPDANLSASLSFINFPAQFNIKFYTNGIENKWIPKTMMLALTNISENLSSDNSLLSYFENTFDKSGNPTRSVKLKLEFKELELLTRSRINQGY